MDIKAHISKLDPGNADHWTTAGLPSVSAVSELAGEPVTRSQIAEAYPGYDREKANAGASSEEPPVIAQADEKPASTERDGDILGDVIARDGDPQVVQELEAARPPVGAEKDELADEGPDGLAMLTEAMGVLQGPRYMRNNELQALVRQFMVQEPSIHAWQARLDQRAEERDKHRAE